MTERNINFLLVDANSGGLVFGISYIDDPKGVPCFGLDLAECVNISPKDFRAKFFRRFDNALKSLQQKNPIVKTRPSSLIVAEAGNA